MRGFVVGQQPKVSARELRRRNDAMSEGILALDNNERVSAERLDRLESALGEFFSRGFIGRTRWWLTGK